LNASGGVAYCIVSPSGCTGFDGTTTGPLFSSDVTFNITVKDPIATPEPSSAHLVFTGLAALLALGWLRSRS